MGEGSTDRASGGAGIFNIGPVGRRRRWALAVVTFTVGAALLAALVTVDAGRLWRLAAFPFFWLAALGFFQAAGRTCVVLAARGERDLDDGAEAIRDEAERLTLRRRGRLLQLLTFAGAVALTALALALPRAG